MYATRTTAATQQPATSAPEMDYTFYDWMHTAKSRASITSRAARAYRIEMYALAILAIVGFILSGLYDTQALSMGWIH